MFYYVPMRYTFPKKEHLTGQKNIEELYRKGESFLVFPYRVVFLGVSETNEQLPVRALMSVSKKRFKKAVHRNRVKRLMRESYRQNKMELHQFLEDNGGKLHLSFQYVSQNIEEYHFMFERMQKTLQKMIQLLAKADSE